jgi:hypothetical protein
MILSDIKVRQHLNECELTAQLTCDTGWILEGRPFELWYRFPADDHAFLDAGNADPFLAALLAPAMCLGEPLKIEGAVSPKLLRASKQIQEIYRCWQPALKFVEVDVAIDTKREAVTSSGSGRNGLFFSLGVDSGYSLAKNLREHPADEEAVTDLITVLGFDVYLWEQQRFVAMLENAKKVGASLGKTVLPVSTNLRDFTDKIADWVQLYHGAALASVALALGTKFRHMLIAATHTYADLFPHGSHPVLDPLWSTQATAFSHDGCEADRLQKIRGIGDIPELLANLRVCATGEMTDAYNCGTCEKCLRTMIGLHIAGVLGKCATLPHEIDLDRVRTMPARRTGQRVYLRQLADALGPAPGDVAIKEALEDCLDRTVVKAPARAQ